MQAMPTVSVHNGLFFLPPPLLKIHCFLAFYFGAIANVLVEDINDAGGNMTLEDFANYFAAVRVPQSTWYHGSEILTGPAPSRYARIICVSVAQLKSRQHLQWPRSDRHLEHSRGFPPG